MIRKTEIGTIKEYSGSRPLPEILPPVPQADTDLVTLTGHVLTGLLCKPDVPGHAPNEKGLVVTAVRVAKLALEELRK